MTIQQPGPRPGEPAGKPSGTPGTEPRRRIGLLGGTFDPPHIGHLVVADQVLSQLSLDEVRLVVTNSSWQKVGSRDITSPERRLAMVEAAVDGIARVCASSVELDLGGSSYTIATLEELTRREPAVDWLIIVGADAAAGLDSWHRADELREWAQIVVVNRPGANVEPPPGWDCTFVDIPALDVSSSGLREMIGEGRSVRHLVCDEVMQRLTSWGLYRLKP